jgi:hypothetical protein
MIQSGQGSVGSSARLPPSAGDPDDAGLQLYETRRRPSPDDSRLMVIAEGDRIVASIDFNLAALRTKRAVGAVLVGGLCAAANL